VGYFRIVRKAEGPGNPSKAIFSRPVRPGYHMKGLSSPMKNDAGGVLWCHCQTAAPQWVLVGKRESEAGRPFMKNGYETRSRCHGDGPDKSFHVMPKLIPIPTPDHRRRGNKPKLIDEYRRPDQQRRSATEHCAHAQPGGWVEGLARRRRFDEFTLVIKGCLRSRPWGGATGCPPPARAVVTLRGGMGSNNSTPRPEGRGNTSRVLPARILSETPFTGTCHERLFRTISPAWRRKYADYRAPRLSR